MLLFITAAATWLAVEAALVGSAQNGTALTLSCTTPETCAELDKRELEQATCSAGHQ